MSLNASGLADALADLMGPHRPATPPQAAQAWSKCYDDYARNATSCLGGSPITTAVGKAAMQALLTAAFSAPPGPTSAPNTLQAFAAAIVAFWTPVMFSGATPGIPVAVAAGPALLAGLTAAWAQALATRASPKQAAQLHATAFDVATRLVVVVHAPPSACAGPIS